MKRFIAILIATTAIAAVAWSQERMISMGDSLPPIPYSQFVEKNILIMDIETVNHEEPTCDYIDSPASGWGKSITNNAKVPGRLVLSKGGNILYDSGDYVESISGMTIRIRGNSSAYKPQKPYKIDLEQKADLLMRNDPNYKDKDWVLIRDIYYLSMFGFEVNKALEMSWTPGYGYVSVILNDNYLGLYMLAESVKRNTNSRINVTKKGFLFEYDSYWWTQDYYIPSVLYTPIRYTVKYPSPLNNEEKQYLEQRVQQYESSVQNGTYTDQIDVASFAKWCLGLDILSVNDAAGANRFLTIYDRTSKIVIPTMWDFDSAEQYPNLWSRTHRVLMPPFFNNSNIAFKRQFVEEWERLSPIIVSKINSAFIQYRNSEKGLMLQRACDFEMLRWNHCENFRSCILMHIDWLKSRKAWIDNNIQQFYIKGDINHDWVIDVEDVNISINMILGLTPSDVNKADINGDHIIDVEDINLLINSILKLQ